jgi:hypothetical protein
VSFISFYIIRVGRQCCVSASIFGRPAWIRIRIKEKSRIRIHISIKGKRQIQDRIEIRVNTAAEAHSGALKVQNEAVKSQPRAEEAENGAMKTQAGGSEW